MMISWLTAAEYLWGVMFMENFTGFMCSRKERLVDDGGEHSTTNSLMGRMRYIYENLPDEIHDYAPISFTHLKVSCPSRKSYVAGEGTSPHTGRGGNFARAVIDEAAMIEKSQSVYRSIRLACPTGLKLQSTPNGRGNIFANIKFENQGNFRMLRYHWTRHPKRTKGLYHDERGRPRSAWYDMMCASMTPDAIARELDISYAHSVSGLVYSEFDEDIHVPLTDMLLDHDLPVCVGIDPGGSAATAGVIFQVHNKEMWCLDDFEIWGADPDVVAPVLWKKIQDLGFRGQKKDVRFYCDPAANAKELSKRSSTVVNAYAGHGFTNFTTPRHGVQDGIRLLKRKMYRREFYVHPRCKHVRRRIPDYACPTDDLGFVTSETPPENIPSRHIMDGIRYAATGIFPIDDILSDRIWTQMPKKEDLIVIPTKKEVEAPARSTFQPIVRVKRVF